MTTRVRDGFALTDGAAGRLRRRFAVQGVVQGVGFRPFVYVTAIGLGLAGSVANDSSGLVIEVEGDPGALREFASRLRRDAPSLAVIDRVTVREVPLQGGTDFTIGESTSGDRARTLASPDVATCADCLRELVDPADRRYRHAFITCTNCGPRFTIITGLPYDRPSTTMAGFPMCPECADEYGDPADRRFHAQPIACRDCGPVLELVERGDRLGGEAALGRARRLLAEGAILAVKGLGGYHLVCDATNETTVAELRRRKRRQRKPFAIMVRDLGTARGLVTVDGPEQALLESPSRPIVLLGRRPGTVTVAPSVAPGCPDLGVLLPYTPLHLLLFGLAGDPSGPEVLVMTSGNLGGEPIVYDDAEALSRLDPLVDAWLRHDRPIAVPCDDSVSRVVDSDELAIRRSRGYAPLPVALPFDVPSTLAVGADLTNTFCLADGRYAWMSQHIGDMEDLATLEAFATAEGQLEALTGVVPSSLVADSHPGYRSAAWARRHVGERTLHTVQHHHAHVASVMGEHGLDDGDEVIGVAFDGTGYGADGAVWGGEVLVAEYASYRRVAHLAYVPLPGGDATVRRPYRMALAHLWASGVGWDPDLPPVGASTPPERDVLAHQLATGFGCTPTSSMGRLFDAVSSLVGVCQVVDYEAQAAIELEGVSCDGWTGPDGYAFDLRTEAATGAMLLADAAPVIRGVVADLRSGTPAELIGARFHAAVADLVVVLAERVRGDGGPDTVVLAGGVFQNAILLSAIRRQLQDRGFKVRCPRRLPPNDGGLALGQVLVHAAGRGAPDVPRSARTGHQLASR